MRQSVILLNDTGTKVNVTGQKIRAAGYYGSCMNLYTVAFYLNDFSGRLFIEGSLANDPCEDDWFPIHLNGYLEYIEFLPFPPNLNNDTGVTATIPLTFQGNFVWLRAKVERNFLQNPDTTNYGQVSKILINF